MIERFSTPVQSERSFLEQVQAADLRLGRHSRSHQPISAEIYTDPLIRAAYLLRHLKLAALCGGAGPEAITLVCLHKELGGQALEATVLDLNAPTGRTVGRSAAPSPSAWWRASNEDDQLRDDLGFPGMRILQFAFGDDPRGALFRPESNPPNCVV